IPAAPLILEAQGFYNRPVVCSRQATIWPLFKGCLFIALGLILACFFLRMVIPRSVLIWFGVISFILVFIKEEILGWASRSKFGQAQYRRRFILVGKGKETGLMRSQLGVTAQEGIEIVAELDLNENLVQRLVEMLHEHAVNGVILNARHSYFEQAEAAIAACELEGVEAWLVADFFKTQISRTSFDEFYGHPVLVFRTAPEASWQSVSKQLL